MKVYSPRTTKLRTIALLISLTCLLSDFTADAALTTYLKLTLKGEWIQGDTLTSAYTNLISCSSFESEIYKPGAPETPMVHRPIKFVKPMDRATPKIGEAFLQNFTGTAEFRFYQLTTGSGSGVEVNFMTVTLSGVRVKSQRILMPNNLNPDLMRYSTFEEVTLSYTSITIHHEVSGYETTLDVAAP